MVTRPLEAARVFISCGQNKDTNEVTIAVKIRSIIQSLGFDPFIAVDVQTLQGLKESIFTQIKNSEYFIFVDFRREKLADNPPQHRGSLFSHQELAVASYLTLRCWHFKKVVSKRMTV